MNRESKLCVLSALALVAFVGLAPFFLSASQTARRQTFSVSIPELHVSTRERVVGFEIHIASGRVAGLPNAPIGWNISIDNDPSWNTRIQGSIKVGSAAVSPAFLREFLFVEKDESLGVPFRMEGEVVVTEDFAAERHISIGNKDLVLKETALLKSTGR